MQPFFFTGADMFVRGKMQVYSTTIRRTVAHVGTKTSTSRVRKGVTLRILQVIQCDVL